MAPAGSGSRHGRVPPARATHGKEYSAHIVHIRMSSSAGSDHALVAQPVSTPTDDILAARAAKLPKMASGFGPRTIKLTTVEPSGIPLGCSSLGARHGFVRQALAAIAVPGQASSESALPEQPTAIKDVALSLLEHTDSDGPSRAASPIALIGQAALME